MAVSRLTLEKLEICTFRTDAKFFGKDDVTCAKCQVVEMDESDSDALLSNFFRARARQGMVCTKGLVNNANFASACTDVNKVVGEMERLCARCVSCGVTFFNSRKPQRCHDCHVDFCKQQKAEVHKIVESVLDSDTDSEDAQIKQLNSFESDPMKVDKMLEALCTPVPRVPFVPPARMPNKLENHLTGLEEDMKKVLNEPWLEAMGQRCSSGRSASNAWEERAMVELVRKLKNDKVRTTNINP